MHWQQETIQSDLQDSNFPPKDAKTFHGCKSLWIKACYSISISNKLNNLPWRLYGSFGQPGCDRFPPLGQKSIVPVDRGAPHIPASVWMMSTNNASSFEMGTNGILSYHISRAGSRPVIRGKMYRLLLNDCTYRPVYDVTCAPSECPTKWNVLSDNPRSKRITNCWANCSAS